MGFRVIKTAAGTLAAIATALLFGVDNPLAAGILAILGIDTTRWRGLKTVFARFVASVLGLFVASLLFVTLGFHIWVLSLFILVSYPLFARFGLKEGIVTGSVIVFHLFAYDEVSWWTLGTELKLLSIGFGWATVFNLIYMPREKPVLETLRLRTEQGFSDIFRHLAAHLRNPDGIWGGEELLTTEAAIEQGIDNARRAQENRLIPQNEPWLLYFHMRRQQLDSIHQMVASVAFISHRVPQAELIAVLFDRLTEDVKSDYYEGETERMLSELEDGYGKLPLPQTRADFESRAALFQTTKELRRFLAVASREKKRKSTSEPALI